MVSYAGQYLAASLSRDHVVTVSSVFLEVLATSFGPSFLPLNGSV